MYTQQDLDDAVAAGALAPEAASGLREFVAQRNRSRAADEEYFRLVTGFNDIFVVIAGGLLLLALLWMGRSVSFGGACLGVALAAWGLAEFFVRRRRMALPAIVFLAAFVLAVFFGVAAVAKPLGESAATTLAAAVTAAAALAHWRRFHVPITPAATAGIVIVSGLVVAAKVIDAPFMRWIMAALAVCGLAVFAWALRWDASDVRRETRRADIAFWLHLLAAPMMVHPLFSVMGVLRDTIDWQKTVAVVLVYVFFGLVSLAIDRRALMVSALGYVLFACAEMLQHSASIETGFATAAFVVSAALLLLSARWQASRLWVLGRLPPAWQSRLPPPR